MSEGPTSPIRVTTALLADFAKVEQSGLLSVVGGGIANVHVGALPSQLTLAVVLQLLAQEAVTGTVALEVRRPTRESAFTINGELSPQPGPATNLAVNLSLLIDTPGEWMVIVSFGNQSLVELPFLVTAGRTPE